MNMTRTTHFFWLLVLLFLSFLSGCTRQEKEPTGRKMSMKTDLLLRTTPVKNQGNSELCWIYAMLGTIECDRLQKGDSVNLSSVYMARTWLHDQLLSCYFSGGRKTVSMRGMATMTLHLLQQHGAHPYDYSSNKEGDKQGAPSWKALARKGKRLADIAVGRKSGLKTFEKDVEKLLDEETGFMPRFVHLYGATYSPQEFAHSVSLPGEYVAMTSFTHHPFGESFVLEVPDNQLQDRFLNVPIDTLLQRVVSSLYHGHAVCWEGDTSEPHAKGIYDLSAEATQEERQQQFECFKTTDDHCMVIVGLAHSTDGRMFFICKNSWGTDYGYQGFCYMSYEYALLKTIAVIMHRDL